ncbi:MAG: serine hydrolase, partial [candidate division KSB1 bacterium]|nr:serine hydrolase [candidate division KSB1 bacterium]
MKTFNRRFLCQFILLVLLFIFLAPSQAARKSEANSCGCVATANAPAYPLDGYDRTGIKRLKAFKLVQEGKMRGTSKLPPGAMLAANEIKLRLHGQNERYDISAATPRDPVLQKGLAEILKNRDPNYSIAILDITDPQRPRYAAVREDSLYSPGSIGKLLVMTGLFDQLAKVFPDTAARIRTLKNTKVTADDWALRDQHEVPFYDEATGKISYRIIKPGDTFTLWEFVDHMVSPSANAAASMVWKQVMLIDQFKTAYPVSNAMAEAYFKDTKKSLLTEQSVRVLRDPLAAVGMPEDEIRHGTLFTGGGQRAVPGIKSYITPKQMLRWLLKMEQGKLVDGWSSLEMKKLMYFTRRRYRYASSPALDSAAVYFKSGSLYSCKPEAGFKCRKYMGNVKNI